MQCEDLFSLLRAVHENRAFAIGVVVYYEAGKAAGLAARITAAQDAWVRRALLVRTRRRLPRASHKRQTEQRPLPPRRPAR